MGLTRKALKLAAESVIENEGPDMLLNVACAYVYSHKLSPTVS